MPYMQAMSKIFRLLQDQVGDTSRNASTRALAADMEWSTLSAKEAVPLGTLILPESEKTTLLDGYRRQFIKLMRQELDLEEQLLNNDNRAAAKTLAAMEDTENEGHEKFR
jgi:soluble cytochrome b562